MMRYFIKSVFNPPTYVKKSSNLYQSFLFSSQEAIKIDVNSDDCLGQPSNKTHPHLVKPGEVVSGIKLSEVIKRRENLVQRIIKCKGSSSNHIVIVPSTTTFYMSEDVPYVFRQDSDYRYLTGCLEPDTALMLCISSQESYESILFTREKNKHTELWDGPRTGSAKAVEHFGVDGAYPMLDLKTVLNSKIKQFGSFTLWYDSQSSCQPGINECLTSIIPDSGCEDVLNPENVIHSLRVIKSKAEQKIMDDSCRIISECFVKAMKDITLLKSEHQVFATFDYEAKMKGAELLAYPPVIACGNNANIIHYIKNNQAFDGSELLLVDAGCELHGYSSDVTRTWPVNGKFSDIQKTLYDVVLNVQEECLAYLRLNRPSLESVLEYMSGILYKRLSEAHILSKLAQGNSPRAVAHKFCPHHVGHYLGMDVHDTATIPRTIPVVEGMVVTIEPGVYIRSNNDFSKPEFRGSGIRIEDDVLITADGIKVLSTCPKNLEEIENLCKA